MSVQIGEVNINLRMSMAQFRTDTQAGTQEASAAVKTMAADMSSSPSEARGCLMLLNHELGLQMPRHLTSLIAQIPGLSEAFATMLPIVGVIAAIAVIEKLVKAHEAAKEALATAMDEIGAKDATVLDSLSEKLDQGKLKFLQLADDGAGAAALKLDMLAHTTLVSLVGAFDNLGKSIDDVLKKMGSEGTFARVMGLAQANDDIKNLQRDAGHIRASGDSDAQIAAALQAKVEWYRDKAKADLTELQNTHNQAMGFGALTGGGHASEDQITAKTAEYNTLNDMAKANAIVQQTQAQDTTNIEIEQANKAAAESDKIWLAQNKEYERSLKADEAAETERYKLAVSGIQEAEKQKIDATRQGTQARLDAVLAALKDEEAHGLQDTAFYKSLQEEKVTIATDMANERMLIERKLAVEMGKAEQGMIALSMAAQKEQADYEYASGQITVTQRTALYKQEAAQLLALERQKNADVLAETSANDPNYPVALQKRLDADLQAQARYDNEVVKLDHEAMMQRRAAWDAGFSAMNSGMTTLVGNMVKGSGSIVADVKSMLQNMLASWIDYFVQLEAKQLEAALFAKALGLVTGGIGGSMFSAAGGGTGAVPVSLAQLPNSIPLHASGGNMAAGEAGIVGDAGPELWVPDSPGTVVPQASAKSDAQPIQNFTQHIHGVSDADSFKKSSSQIAADALALMAAAHRRNR
jgi:hypothetical protein